MGSKYLFLESRPNPTTIWTGRPDCYYCSFYIISQLAKFTPNWTKEELIDIMGVIKQMKQVLSTSKIPTGGFVVGSKCGATQPSIL